LTVVVTLLGALCYLVLFFIKGAPSGFLTLLLISMFLGSIQLVCFSIFAEYLGHIYEEIKQRPRFIVRELIDNRCRISTGLPEEGASNTARANDG
jgi:dolichol-phosphate mannosyltransferase